MKMIRYHPRLVGSVVFGLVLYFLLPTSLTPLTRVLISWNAGVFLFLCLVFAWLGRLTAAQICKKYIEEDESEPFILVAVIVAALVSIVAIIEPLATLKQVTGSARIGHLALAACTLINSWLLVPTMFTTHYTDMFYSADKGKRPLSFPDTDEPVFWDFVYFSFTIAAACQTADVCTNGTSIRKAVILHSLISFVFNASILGFAINVTAGLLGGGS
jgi:uncharacterized membrane protein